MRCVQYSASKVSGAQASVCDRFVEHAVVTRECLDWGERRSQLAGSLGRALLTRFEVMKWVKKDARSPVVLFSIKGE